MIVDKEFVVETTTSTDQTNFPKINFKKFVFASHLLVQIHYNSKCGCGLMVETKTSTNEQKTNPKTTLPKKVRLFHPTIPIKFATVIDVANELAGQRVNRY